MLKQSLPWQEELGIIDRTMRAISNVSDPETFVETYWKGIGEFIAIRDYLTLSRKGVEPPYYLITRSSRFTERLNPWTQRDLLPKLSGGLLGEIIYGGEPVIIDDLPARLAHDDPARFYLEGFQALIALPYYDNGEALNVPMLLVPPGEELNHAKIPMLHLQSGLFGRGTQNLVLRNQLADALAALDRELQAVGNIQRSLLPAALPSIKGYEFAAHYETSARAGGDYYDFFPLDDGGWGIFIADVSGHGTPAAVVMAITHSIAHAKPRAHAPPGALLAHLNDQLFRAYTRDGTFVTAFYAVLRPAERTLTYACAGHNPPRLVRKDEAIPLDEIGAMPLGILDCQMYDESTVLLKPGDLLFLYTDGVTEAMAPTDSDGHRELFGTDRLDRHLVSCRSRSALDCIHLIRDRLTSFRATEPLTDDQTLIAMRVVG